jgi:hypothetical protein
MAAAADNASKTGNEGTLPSALSSSSSKPWLTWPTDLPSMGEVRDQPLYRRMFDEKRIREMHQDVRSTRQSTLPPLCTMSVGVVRVYLRVV